MAELKDSGERTEYTTGAVRDCKEGKGRCDLMPLDVVGTFLDDFVITHISEFKETGDVKYLYQALDAFVIEIKDHRKENLIREVAIHFEDGARKYGPNNWQKGIPLHSFIDSAIRHYLKYWSGWTDEPHKRAFVWNILCAIWTCKHRPDLDDFTENEEERKRRLKIMLNKLYGKESVKHYADIANKGE